MLRWMFTILLAASQLHAQNPASVAVDHPVYDFIDRMEALDVTGNLLSGARPLSRGRIAAILGEVDKKRSMLTAIDRRRLDDYLLDFRYEIDARKKYDLIPEGQTWYSTLASWENFKKDVRRNLSQPYPEEENHLFIWEQGDSSFYMDYRQLFSYDGRINGPSRNANEQTYQFRGTVGNFSFQWQLSTQAIRGADLEYRRQDPLLKGTFSQESESGATTFADRTGGELAWHTRAFDVSFAQQPLRWGAGASGQLILSDWAEQYPYISINKNWGWGRFTMIHGKLQSFQQGALEDGTRLYPDKWLAAHRLEISPFGNFSFALNEMFIYGNRYADWSYLFPLNFYRAVQHKLRDRDNATIALDAKWIVLPGVKLYATIFLDEMKFDSLGTNWFGNKQALQTGLDWYDPLGWANSRFTAEYVAIMPWVYTHRFAVNRYETDGRSLGYWAGPNSEVIYFKLENEPHARLRLGVSWRQLKKGHNTENENIGGNILQGRSLLLGTQTEPREKRYFLEGDLEIRRELTLMARYEIFNDLYLSASYIFTHGERKQINENYQSLHFGFLFDY
ncbi:MAG TPA: hypothetical protein ENK44_01685 [Caldithrix abyssi]|uniref:Capsule assembly Wzi family protein n=1 Tax=Caldithrix abyssi TaxID=187145 RepID=A0A7V4TY26_CALAY|nr:hypothetical protein [Caldithrix abyssi]